jgi:MFS family permease
VSRRLSLKTMARSLRHRNYRLFFTGQAISLIGTWMTRVATSWMVYRLTEDPVMLGVVNFAGLIPSFVLGPLCGVLVDRTDDLKRLISRTQLAAMLQSFGLVAAAALPLSTSTVVATLIALNVLQGVINAFDVPARQAFLPRMIPNQADLANGIALNSTLFNSARLIGPALAGGLIGAIGELGCYIVDAVSYIGVLWALAAMAVPALDGPVRERPAFWAGLKDGLAYAYRHPSIKSLIMLVAVLSFVGMPYNVLLPIYAKDILHGGARTLGLLTAAAGCGAVLAALVLSTRDSIEGLARWILLAGLVFGGSLAAFAYSRSVALSAALLLLVGFGMLLQTSSCSTVIQTVVDPSKRGRVMSLYSTAFLGMAPFGSLVSGYLAKHLGPPATLGACAGVCVVASAFFARRLRPGTARAA